MLNGLNALSAKVLKASASTAPRRWPRLPASPDPATQHFWKKFRSLTIGAYYTTDAGFKDIGYTGNVPRASDPGPSAEVRAVLERELQATRPLGAPVR